MEASLDMNSQRIINLPEPLAATDAARLQDVIDAASGLDSSTLLLRASNLSDLADVQEALGNLGLEQVDNTADAAKPVSTAVQAQLDLKVPKAGGTLTGALVLSGDGVAPLNPVTRQQLDAAIIGAGAGAVTSVNSLTGAVVLTKSSVGLANVDNTADTAKPVSTAQQTAIDLKLTKSANLSDVVSPSTARTNLGLGSAAVMTGPSGTIVGTTDTQTLTNKSLTSPTLTGTTSAAAITTSGALTVGSTLSAANIDSPVVFGRTAGNATYSNYISGGNTRWLQGRDGSDNFNLLRYTGSSVFQDTPVSVDNATGTTTLTKLAVSGTSTFGGTAAMGSNYITSSVQDFFKKASAVGGWNSYNRYPDVLYNDRPVFNILGVTTRPVTQMQGGHSVFDYGDSIDNQRLSMKTDSLPWDNTIVHDYYYITNGLGTSGTRIPIDNATYGQSRLAQIESGQLNTPTNTVMPGYIAIGLSPNDNNCAPWQRVVYIGTSQYLLGRAAFEDSGHAWGTNYSSIPTSGTGFEHIFNFSELWNIRDMPKDIANNVIAASDYAATSYATTAIRKTVDPTTGFDWEYDHAGYFRLQPIVAGSKTSDTYEFSSSANSFRIGNKSTPASAGASGRKGQICWDDNYLYVCIDNGNWKRTALSTW